jgi:hypothetical protein
MSRPTIPLPADFTTCAELWQIFLIGVAVGGAIMVAVVSPLGLYAWRQVRDYQATQQFWAGRHRRGYQQRVNGRVRP